MNYLDHFRARVMQDALAEATEMYWLRRADTFEDARPREGDFTGEASVQELMDRDQALKDLAEECRRRAAVRENLGQGWWTGIFS